VYQPLLFSKGAPKSKPKCPGRKPEGDTAGVVADFEARATESWFVLSYQLRKRALRDWDNQHLLKVLREHHRRGE
jgi:hypothetical protein